jgi:pimeloyl-ACP methyl ester carboxylesterase
MKRTLTAFLSLVIVFSAILPAAGQITGAQGKIAYTVTYPSEFDPAKDTCPVVILMHGIFSSKDFIPIPSLAKGLAKAGIASVSFDFGGHWKSEGKMVNMTIERELEDATAVLNYVLGLPCFSRIGFLGHSQGGVVASMLAGRINSDFVEDVVYDPSKKEKVVARWVLPHAMVLIAPGTVIKDACRNGKFFQAKFDPADPPEFVRCWGIMKLGREYLVSTQNLDIYGTAAHYEGPVRIIHGSKDGIVPLRCSEEYLDYYRKDQAELIVVEGENHTITRKRPEVVRLTVEFFKEQLF